MSLSRRLSSAERAADLDGMTAAERAALDDDLRRAFTDLADACGSLFDAVERGSTLAAGIALDIGLEVYDRAAARLAGPLCLTAEQVAAGRAQVLSVGPGPYGPQPPGAHLQAV